MYWHNDKECTCTCTCILSLLLITTPYLFRVHVCLQYSRHTLQEELQEGIVTAKREQPTLLLQQLIRSSYMYMFNNDVYTYMYTCTSTYMYMYM